MITLDAKADDPIWGMAALAFKLWDNQFSKYYSWPKAVKDFKEMYLLLKTKWLWKIKDAESLIAQGVRRNDAQFLFFSLAHKNIFYNFVHFKRRLLLTTSHCLMPLLHRQAWGLIKAIDKIQCTCGNGNTNYVINKCPE